jgi:hypothetical protein
LPVDLGDAKGDGFVAEHCSRTLVTRLTYVAWHITEIANLSDLRCGNLTGLASPGFVGLRGRLTRPHNMALRTGTDLTGNADWTHIRTMMAQGCFVRLLLLARLRHADCIEQCPLSGVTRKTFARTEFFSV